MRKKQARGGIERKFLKAIFWVGIIPMALALIIGYAFARTGFQIAGEENLETAARKTAQGLQWALKGRVRRNKRLLLNSEVQHLFRSIQETGAWPEGEAPRRFENNLERGLDTDLDDVLSYSFYDAGGRFVHRLPPLEVPEPDQPGWTAEIPEYRFELAPRQANDYYSARLITSVSDSDTGALLGFLAEEHDSMDLVEFLVGEESELPGAASGENHYELLDFNQDPPVLIHMADMAAKPGGAGRPAAPPARHRLDERVAARIRSAPEGNSFLQRNFSVDTGNIDVLLSYRRLLPGNNLYILVYRPTADVFANINLAALLTIVISLLVIGFFCVIAYRIVNNNVIRPVSLLNEGAQIIRQGDLELKLKIGTGDEIEELANSFNKMASALLHNIRHLEESEERYRNLITSMRDGIYQTDAEGEITLINPAGAHILGYEDMEEVIGLNVKEVFLDQMDFARATRELSKYRVLERMRVWMKQRDGTAICVELSTGKVFEASADMLSMEGTFRDVTQNMRLEQEAKERAERISAINQIANVINSSLESGLVYESIVVEVKKLVNFNYAAVALYSDEEDLFHTRQLWREREEGVREETIAPSGPGASRLDGEGSCAAWVADQGKALIVDELRNGDSPFATQFPDEVASCLCVPLHAAGKIIGALNFGSLASAAFAKHEIDVLEQMVPHFAVAIRNAQLLDNLQHSLEEVTRARENLHEAIEELKTLDEMKTNLLSNVSHELRTPLVAVMGYTDMILNGKVGPVNDVQAEYLAISLRNIEKLVTLIENLLDFSRLHRGDEELYFDSFDLVEVARTSIQIVQPMASSRKMKLVLGSSKAEDSSVIEEVIVDGDKGKLGQVFNNLLSNAVKFNKSGGEITVNIRLRDDSVEVTVVDSGIGIPEEALDKIFTRFYQYDGSSTRKYGGTGIGLSIAQDIMRLHGSRITVTSTLGKGSTFRFSLPLHLPDQDAGDAGAAQLPIPTETHLLVELVTQDRSLSAQIRNLLVSEGMDVIHAAYPAVAISLAEKYRPDCILVDTEAGPLGSVVMDEILSDSGARELPIVLITNDDALFERYGARVAGRVKRGFRKSALLSGIHYALGRGMDEGRLLGEKVLCVDDDPEIVTFISRCLETEGFETDQCATGEAALEMLAGGDYRLVLLDIAMPGMDGWETCRRIRAQEHLKGIKVYLVTAKPIDRNLTKIDACGADGYLLKPFHADDLSALVREFGWHPRRRDDAQTRPPSKALGARGALPASAPVPDAFNAPPV